jgi:hypothetical protein
MNPQRQRVLRGRQQLVVDRVDEINKRLKYLSSYRVDYVPRGPDSWHILPNIGLFKEQGFPIHGEKFRLLIEEKLYIMITKEEPEIGELRFHSFCYALKKTVDPDLQETLKTDLLPKDWEFRYEFSPRGVEYDMPQACEPDALKNRVDDRLPPFHMHVYEKGTINSDLHYPIGNPEAPLELLFEIIRLILDEFIT